MLVTSVRKTIYLFIHRDRNGNVLKEIPIEYSIDRTIWTEK